MSEEREKRKKRFAPKTRTGCRTCRKRHVKCDEGKPFCSRCIRAEIVCEGYYDSKSFPVTPSEEPSKEPRDREARSRTEESSASDSPRSLSPSFGSHEEQRYLCLYLERTAVQAGYWCAPYFWHKLVPSAAWAHPALKHCVVAMAMTVEMYTTGGTDKALKPDSRRAFHYYKAIGLLTKSDSNLTRPTVEMTAIACITFCAFDVANERPDLATVHLLAASNMAAQIESSPRHDTLLVHVLKELLTGFEQSSSTARRRSESGRPILRPSLQSCSHFHSNGHARISLSSCITAIYMTSSDMSSTKSPTTADVLLGDQNMIDPQQASILDPSSTIPTCSLSDCLALLQKWWKTFYLHKSPTTDTEKEVLRAYYLATKMALDVRLQEAGMLDRPVAVQEQEERLREIFIIAQNASEYRSRHRLAEWTNTDGPAVLQRLDQERGMTRPSDCCQFASDFYPQDEDMTGHSSLFGFVKRKTTDEKLLQKAQASLESEVTYQNFGRVPVLWLDHV